MQIVPVKCLKSKFDCINSLQTMCKHFQFLNDDVSFSSSSFFSSVNHIIYTEREADWLRVLKKDVPEVYTT